MKQYKLKPKAILLKEGSAPEKVQILRTGKFSHSAYGEFEITKDTLKTFKKNFDDRARGIDLAIDYSHNNMDEAAGWFRAVSLNDSEDELWVDVDWTPSGKKALEAKEFRYLSADFSFEYIDAETQKNFGPTLMGAGLTNRPFVKDMAPAVELKEQSGGTMELKELNEKNVKLQEELNVKTARLSEVEKEVVTLKEQNAKLVEEKKQIEEKHAADKKLAERSAKFAALMKDGKACKAQEEAYMAGDMEKFIELAEKVNLDGKGSSETPGDESKETPEAKVLNLAEALVKEGKAKNMDDAQVQVLKANPELAKQL